MSSPPSSSGRSGRGRGRTRGRGSTRITAQDSRSNRVKNERDHAESDAAMPDAYAQQTKQEGAAVEAQQPIKAEHSSIASAPQEPAVQQPFSDEHLQPNAAAALPGQVVPNSLVSGPDQSVQAPESTHEGQIQQEMPHQSMQHVEQTIHGSLAPSPLLPGGLSLPRPSLETLPEEDDYDADE